MNLFELFVKVGVDDQASNELETLTNKLGNGLKKAAKIGTAAVSVASSAIGVLTKQAVEGYAVYEQLVGGAELMFGDAFGYVQQKSQEAYKNVQMSQNEYLQQVNGFATGLKTALGGNEQAAAELADRIITAEADIVAATGNTQENVQNAFNGIMKSNFTMLDNLQIGITPTKEGFQEVIDKVNEWNETNGKATNYQMGNLADMQSALVDYIDMVGYAGYAHNEAQNTISGSIATTKAAWSNLVVGLASDNADVEALINNFVDSAGNSVSQVIPRVGAALNGASKLIQTLVPTIVNQVPKIIEQNLPVLVEAGISIIESLIEGISENQDSLFETILEVAELLTTNLLEMLPQIVQLGIDFIVSLANGIATSIPTLLPTILSVITEIVTILTNPENLMALLTAALSIITALATYLTNPETLSKLIQTALSVIQTLTQFFMENVGPILNAALEIIKSLAEYLLKPTTINQLINTALSIVRSLTEFLMENIGPLLDAAIEIIMSLIEYLLDPENIKMLVEAAIEIVVTLAGALVGAVGELVAAVGELIVEICDAFGETDWLQIGKDILAGIKEGIENAWENFKEWFSGLLDDLIGIAKKILGIASPSKVFKRLGKWTAEGFGIGFDDEFADVEDDIRNSMDFGDFVVSANGGRSSLGNSGRPINITQNIYAEKKSAAQLMQEARWQAQMGVLAVV